MFKLNIYWFKDRYKLIEMNPKNFLNNIINRFLTTLLLIGFATSGFGQIILNEAQSSNSSTISDDFDENDDWIEVYNSNDFAVDIAGLILKDAVDTWQIPFDHAETLLDPGEYFLLWADDQEPQGPFHTNFKLASGGEYLGLFDEDGETIIDEVTLPALESDQSLSRCNDGSWVVTNSPTPLGVNNGDCSSGLESSEAFSINLIAIENGIQILLDNSGQHESVVQLFLLSGVIVHEEVIVGNVCHVDELNSGIYVLRLINGSDIYSEKIIIGS